MRLQMLCQIIQDCTDLRPIAARANLGTKTREERGAKPVLLEKPVQVTAHYPPIGTYRAILVTGQSSEGTGAIRA